eukprot:2558084-Alexandrium_andersonii.AAC.1
MSSSERGLPGGHLPRVLAVWGRAGRRGDERFELGLRDVCGRCRCNGESRAITIADFQSLRL